MSRNAVSSWLEHNRMARIAAKLALALALIVGAWVIALLLLYGLWVVLEAAGVAFDRVLRMARGIP